MTALPEARMKSSPDVVDGFRVRGREVTHLESFADAILAFALTLLITDWQPCLRQSQTAANDGNHSNAQDIFHYHSDRLHQFAAAHRTRLRESPGRRHRALSSAQ